MKFDSYQEIGLQNRKRFIQHIQKLKVNETGQIIYYGEQISLWNPQKVYVPDKGNLSTYFNFIIRNHLMDLIQDKSEALQYKAIQEIVNIQSIELKNQ